MKKHQLLCAVCAKPLTHTPDVCKPCMKDIGRRLRVVSGKADAILSDPKAQFRLFHDPKECKQFTRELMELTVLMEKYPVRGTVQ